VEITVNGSPRKLEAGTTVATLLRELNMLPKFVAVERNLELIPRREHEACVLEEGDQVEVVTLVGGG
jgi:thiamine biosynthesis protein ThiS